MKHHNAKDTFPINALSMEILSSKHCFHLW